MHSCRRVVSHAMRPGQASCNVTSCSYSSDLYFPINSAICYLYMLALLRMLCHHLCNVCIHTVECLLPLLFPPVEGALRHANRNLVLACLEPSPRCFRKVFERHADLSAVLDVRLVFFVMQLGLYGGREDLDNLDVTRSVLELLSEHQNEVMQCRLGSTVVRASHHRNLSDVCQRTVMNGAPLPSHSQPCLSQIIATAQCYDRSNLPKRIDSVGHQLIVKVPSSTDRERLRLSQH